MTGGESAPAGHRMPDAFLALDQGGHASRAIAYDTRGRQVAAAFAEIATQRPAPDVVEHDPDELIASLLRVVGDAARQCAAAGHRVVAAGLATQRSSIACWDPTTGRALSPVISWQDRRNAAWLARFEPKADWIRARTGLALTPHYGASKMRWCLDHLPAVAAANAAGRLAMGPLASFVVHRLCAQRPLLADPANASRTQLWDPATQDWSPELLALFGIGRATLPRCVTSRYRYGTFAAIANAAPLAVVTGDQSAMPFAFGPLDPATAYVNVGTGAFVQRAIRDRLPEAPRLLASVVWSEAARVDFTLEGTVNGAGSALDWFAAREGVDVAPMLAALAQPGATDAEPPLFVNAVSGLGSPFWASGLESRFVGAGGAEARLLAVLESIVFLIANNLDCLRPHGPPFARVVLTGGLASNDRFCRCLADLCRLPVFRSREREATARGLAYLVAGLPADWPADAAGDTFEPQANPRLAARFASWRAATDDAIAAHAEDAPRKPIA